MSSYMEKVYAIKFRCRYRKPQDARCTYLPTLKFCFSNYIDNYN